MPGVRIEMVRFLSVESLRGSLQAGNSPGFLFGMETARFRRPAAWPVSAFYSLLQGELNAIGSRCIEVGQGEGGQVRRLPFYRHARQRAARDRAGQVFHHGQVRI